MKFGIRTPSLNKRIAARTSLKRYVRHSLGFKAPRGMGFITHPKKFAYNKVYSKTSFSFKFGGKKSNKTSSRNSCMGCLYILLVLIGLAVAIVFWFITIPIGLIVGFIYLRKKINNKKPQKQQEISINDDTVHKEQEIGAENIVPTNIDNEDNIVKVNSIAVSNHDVSKDPTLFIPEPTRSLLWVTNESVDKISSPMSIVMTASIYNGKVDVRTEKGNNFFAEPSLIWTKLEIEKNNDLETSKMYYPSYSRLYPRNRYQYLNWLRDITQPTNLSYVFLYYYGLERHLLVGNYDGAVDEIIRLLKVHHDEGTFSWYACRALISASFYKGRQDILQRAGDYFDSAINEVMILKLMNKETLEPESIIKNATTVGFKNRRYINLYPDLFKKVLRDKLVEFESKNGKIADQIDILKLPREATSEFANISIPENIRNIKIPVIIEDPTFKKILYSLLSDTHNSIKEQKLYSK